MDALLFAPVAVAIALTPGPNNFCGLNNGIRAGVGAALVATVGRVAALLHGLTSLDVPAALAGLQDGEGGLISFPAVAGAENGGVQ